VTVGREEPGIEKFGKTLLVSRASTEECLRGPAQDQWVQHAYAAGGFDEEGSVIDADREAVLA
jgi:hypothetical protein